MAINSTLAIRVELESGSPDGARGAELLTTETFFFTWETHEFERNRMLHKRLEKMIFRNEHNQDNPIELSKADFHMWQFDPLNPHDMTVRGRLHTAKKSCLGHVILTIIFDDPYRIFHTTYKPLLDNPYVKSSSGGQSNKPNGGRRSKFDEMRKWNEQRSKNDNYRYPNSSPLGLQAKTPPNRIISSRNSNSNSYGKSSHSQMQKESDNGSSVDKLESKQPVDKQTSQVNQGQTLNSIGNPNSPEFSP